MQAEMPVQRVLPARRTRLLATAVLLPALLGLAGCQSAYYAAWEKLGYEKRDILTSRVEDARDAQQDAKETVVSALEAFSKTVNFSGGELEDQYARLKGQLERSDAAATDVRERVDKVESTGEALFREWKAELGNYTNADLKARSAAEMDNTRVRYDRMIVAMRKARDRLEPALRPLRDQVLFLKHNLNARALSSIKGEVAKVDAEVDKLISDVNRSVEEANRFIKEL